MARVSDIYRRSRSSGIHSAPPPPSSSGDGGETILPEESPAERFARLFDPRLVNARRAIRAVGNLGGARYEANEDAVREFYRAIREESEMAIHELERNVQKWRARKKS